MDSEVSKILPEFFKKHWLPLLLALFGLIFFIYGLIALFSQNPAASDIKFETNSNIVSKENENLITVDIEGAVSKPGVYKLKLGSIIQDGLVVAGGLSIEANRDFVSKNINLATKLTDGQKIYIPRKDENNPSVLGLGTESASSLVNINMASEQELDTLSGIGPVTADKIINNRPYSDINDLLSRKVVSQKVFDQIKDKITAY